MRFPALLIAAAAIFGIGPLPTSPARVEWWTADALIKVHPYDPPPKQPALPATVEAARNEFEPFQIVLRGDSADLEGVDVEVTDLRGARGAVIPRRNVHIYLEQYVSVRLASSSEGHAGDWPDALVPRVDEFAHERRNAFPFALRRGRNQPLWVEIYVPPDAQPGDYEGAANVMVAGAVQTAIPIRLTVWDFALPSTSTLRTAFGFSGVTALKQHRGGYTTDADLYEITRSYARAALLHRVSLYGGSMVPPPFSRSAGGVRVDWKDYDAEVGPLLDGTALGADDPLPGARATAVEIRTPRSAASDETKVAYWREWSLHFKEKGWYGRLYHYLWDEPAARDQEAVVRQGLLMRQADPKIPSLVTTALDPLLAPVVGIWCPLINCFEGRPEFPPYCPAVVTRKSYEPELAAGKRLWWYQSCASHGCTGRGGAYFTGWPSYVIDAPATAHRIMPWIAWKYGIEGELYFNVNDSYVREADPWQETYAHGGNGDGTLFYPGTPARIGGTRDIPIESIRLKLVREGLEDHEYLALLERAGDRAAAAEAANRIVSNAYTWERRPEALREVRRTVAARLSAHSSRLQQ
jgi:hypothetical protein